MSRIEQPMAQIVSRPEQSAAAPPRSGRSGHRSPLRTYLNSDFQTLVKPEDVARGEVFFNSTCFWI